MVENKYILILGSNGLLGSELAVTCKNKNIPVVGISKSSNKNGLTIFHQYNIGDTNTIDFLKGIYKKS